MRIRSMAIVKVLTVSITCIVVCSKEPPMAPACHLEGDCVGTVRDETGSPAAGASLLLVPEEYSPLSAANENGIDSTTSDAYGRYGFIVDAPGAYNLLAKSKGFYAMRRTIRISADARVILAGEILREPGSMSGMVHLQGESDHRGAIILLMGTNVYAKPFDSTGAFSVTALAEGSYLLRILTAKNDYIAAETTVTVVSGLQTALPCIELQKKFVPVIDSLSVAYDPVMMRAVLSWTAIDTAKITNYAVYCNRPRNLEPVAIVDKSTTTYSFDVFTSPLDTFLFEISSIGNDNIEGPSTSGKSFVKYSAIELDTITCAVSLSLKLRPPFYFDRRDNIFTVLGKKITKLDPEGNFLAEFALPDTPAAGGFKQLGIDTAGNIYALTNAASSLMKFDNNLQPLRELPLDTLYNFSFAVSAAGAFMLHAIPYPRSKSENNITFGTLRLIYDSQFNLVEKDSLSEELSINRSVTADDATVCLLMDNDLIEDRVVYFDCAFKEISPPVDIDSCNDKLSSWVPQGYSGPQLNVALKNLFAAKYSSESLSTLCMLLFFDDRLQPIARVPFAAPVYPFGPFFTLTFDCRGNCYLILATDENNMILKFSVAEVLK